MTEERGEAVLSTQQEIHLQLDQVIAQRGLSATSNLDHELREYLIPTSSNDST